jgi:hypothetical protein
MPASHLLHVCNAKLSLGIRIPYRRRYLRHNRLLRRYLRAHLILDRPAVLLSSVNSCQFVSPDLVVRKRSCTFASLFSSSRAH